MSFISTNLSWLQCSPANITQSPAEEEYTPMRRALGSQEYKVGGPSDLAVSAHFPIKAQIKLGVASNRIDCQKREFDKFTQINLITAKWPMFHLCSCQPGKRTYPTWIRPKWTIFGVGMRGVSVARAKLLHMCGMFVVSTVIWEATKPGLCSSSNTAAHSICPVASHFQPYSWKTNKKKIW